jgi:oxygen-independent coproporphyrinogen-3 oxidase
MRESGADEAEIEAYFLNGRGVEPEKFRLLRQIDEIQRGVIGESRAKKGKKVCLYLSVPFCPTRCAYCSFVTVGMENMRQTHMGEYLAAMRREIDATARIARDLDFEIGAVYFGGGTPTTLSDHEMDGLLDYLGKSFDLSKIEEFTVEAGRPDSITAEKLWVLKAHGVTRVSVNPQSMNQKTLEKIGRAHTVAQTVEAYELARKFAFREINMDLILGLYGEDLKDFQYSLDAVCGLAPENITVHALCQKRAARSNMAERRADFPLPSSETARKMSRYASEKLAKEGYLPYYLYRQKNILGNLENVGYAREGHWGVYNILMMEEIETVLGIGCGAVTKLVKGAGEKKIERLFGVKDPLVYLARLDEALARKQYIYEFFGAGY